MAENSQVYIIKCLQIKFLKNIWECYNKLIKFAFKGENFKKFGSKMTSGEDVFNMNGFMWNM